jgi:cyclopropane-fatty-acyl-phospholipid synthase
MSEQQGKPWVRSTGHDVRTVTFPPSLRLALSFCTQAVHGALEIALADGRVFRFGDGAEPRARIDVVDPRFARRAVLSGDVGFAESYMEGMWTSPDLTSVLQFFGANFDHAKGVSHGQWFWRAVHTLRHAMNANTRKGSRKNILAHYDLGNDFYAHWLDPTMTYSSAIFTRPDEDLSLAQTRKYEAIAEKLTLAPDQHVLEIGSGWGGFAEHAARTRGARVTTVTISDAQYAFARDRIFKAGLNERVEVRLSDYRDVEGRFDAVASIEMFEAVGERYWPQYFTSVADALNSGAKAALQVITIDEQLFEDYKRSADFIQRYIFPGGMLPSVERLRKVAGEAGLTMQTPHMFGDSYARTLDLWQQRFNAAWDDIRTDGFDERFRRLWNFYLSYCSAGFRSGRIDVGQFAFTRT